MLPLAFVGSLTGPSGRADEARALLGALEATGHEPGAVDLTSTDRRAGLSPAEEAQLRRQLRRGVGQAAVVVHHYPPHRDQVVVPERANVGRAMFETDAMPASFLGPLLARDEVWVPSEFNVETFRRGGIPTSRMRVVGETIDFDRFDPAATGTIDLGAPEGHRVFLTTFDLSERRGWRQLLEGWTLAFGEDDPVALVLKLTSMHCDAAHVRARIDETLAALQRRHGRRAAPVVLFDRMLRSQDVPRLYAAADAFVLPSRGEGWGRPCMEALAMGLPTIASGWSGMLAFMDPATSWLLDGRLVDVDDDAEAVDALSHGHRWFEADTEHLAATFREIAADVDAASRRAAPARADLIDRFGQETISRRLTEAAADAAERHAVRARTAVTCVWRGRFGSDDSLRVVNDALAERLEGAGHHVVRRSPDAVAAGLTAPSVSHSWPPVFEPGSDGPAVVVLPWEFGHPPRSWVEAARTRLDRVLVPSAYVRDGYVEGGMPPGIVEVVPNGTDLDRFTPDGPRMELPGAASCTFLFVGGTIARKGIDLLLEGWKLAFGPDDDVRLVLKDFAFGGTYSTADDLVERHRADPECASIVHLTDHLGQDELPALYRAADVVVLPYRGEGFCLPALEALACGRPVVHTGVGPTSEFVPPDAGWALPAHRRELGGVIGQRRLELTGSGFWHEVDPRALADTLQAIAVDERGRARRAAAARPAAEACSWERATEALERTLGALADERLPLARTIRPAHVPDARSRVVLYAASPDDPRWAATLTDWTRLVDADADVTLVLAVPPEQVATAPSAAADALGRAGLDLERLPDLAVLPVGDGGLHGLVARADAVLVDREPHELPAALTRRAARILTAADLSAFASALRPQPAPPLVSLS